MSLKIIHCADVHFDSAMSGLDAKKVNIRRDEMKRTFARIIDLSQNADMLIIAGDLFDGKHVSKSTLDFLKGEFSKIPDTKVYIIGGNHDFLGADSVYRAFEFGSNVHVFGTETECVETPEYDIWGASFKSANDEREMLSSFMVKNADKINIGIFHANIGGNDYNPLKVADIEKSGLDYLALGHIHKATEIKQVGTTHYAYCGCPEGRGYDETGEKGVYAIELTKGNILRADFVPVCERMYFDEEIDVTDIFGYDEIVDKINEKYKGEKHIYRFTLTGKNNMAIDTDVLCERIDAFSLVVRDNTKPAVDIEKLSEEFSLKGLFARYALADKGNMSEEEFNEALKVGLNYIEKEENNENR
ncbi:MAG: metallophosphoesterase [Clostridia bacterium]|nr:metallophosphoesterase [Clostridia bacterium]